MYLYEVATESVCESAARLLFMSIKWAKSVPAFSTLSLQDQVNLTQGGEEAVSLCVCCFSHSSFKVDLLLGITGALFTK